MNVSKLYRLLYLCHNFSGKEVYSFHQISESVLYSEPVKITWDNVWKLVSMVQVRGIAKVTWELNIPYWNIVSTYAKTTSISQRCSGNLGVWWPSAHQGSYSLISETMYVRSPFHTVELWMTCFFLFSLLSDISFLLPPTWWWAWWGGESSRPLFSHKT